MNELPSGTVAFLFADIDGATALWERDHQAMRAAIDGTLAILDTAITTVGGARFKTVGDAVQAAFPSVPAAVAATLQAQGQLAQSPWPALGVLPVRMAIHVGEATPREGDYLAPALNRLARVLGAGHGGQILLTAAAAALARDALPARATLRDLGVHRLRDLLEAEPIYQLLHPELTESFPPLRSLDARLSNLPVQPTTLIGRERELAELVPMVRDGEHRLVTLSGPGGTGKTRLAVQVAAELIDAFSDGVYMAPLASVTDAALVPATIASELGLREAVDQAPRDLVLTWLAGKRLLLVLDNLEHIPDVAPFVAEMLAAEPGLSILATSRMPLRLPAERQYAIGPLPLPPMTPSEPLNAATANGFEAVRLFVERARAVKPDFAIDDQNAPFIAEIVQRLDGLPLAIELAAARVRLFSPRALLDRLQKRLPLLTGGARDLPARQRALRETVAWSYDLLGAEEARLFRRLAIFAGGFSREAATDVAGDEPGADISNGIDHLAEHSLIQRSTGQGPHERFRMLETVREYGLELLTEAAEVQTLSDRHARYLLDLAQTASAALELPDSDVWLDRLETEHDNLRAALAWSSEQRSTVLPVLAGALGPFWEIRGHFSEGRDWLERALAHDTSSAPRARAAVLTAAGSISRLQGDSERATELLQEALDLWRELDDQQRIADVLVTQGHVAERLGDLAGAGQRFTEALAIGRELHNALLTGIALTNLGIVADQQGDYAEATARYDEALAIFRALGDRRRESIALDNLGNVARARGDLATATRYFRASLAVSRDVGDAWGVAGTQGNLGQVAHQLGDLAGAEAHIEASLAEFRTLGDRRGVAIALDNLGLVVRDAGDLPRAAALHGEGLALAQDLGDRISVAFGLEGIAAVASESGRFSAAVRLYGAADALRAMLGAPVPPDNRAQLDQTLTLARTQLGEAGFAEGWHAGQSLDPDDAVQEALALAGVIVDQAESALSS